MLVQSGEREAEESGDALSSGKERILAVERILQRRKSVSAAEIIRILWDEYDIAASEATIYDDIAALTRYLHINSVGRGKKHRYELRSFENILK